MKVIIIGAGIGGLTTAIALQQLGHEVIVYEQSSEIKALGAGIVLAANAMTALRKLGIEQKIIQAGRIVSSFEVVDDQGNVLSEVYANRFFEKYGIGKLHNCSL
jgi:2-polyprenyl-6-methoxyphenol hydroxylase-like FAD-dependent oxidoreductase